MASHITNNDIKQMLKEIELVKSNAFSDGKKYSIEQFEVKNKKRIENLFKKTYKAINDFKEQISDIANFNFAKLSVDDNKEENEEEENEEEDLNTDKTIKFSKIVPFDYDQKGILEENKEFSGFIPQFIALKEGETHKDLIFIDISISYLYISHPIFANFYPCVCGFTGTVGKVNDKETFSNHYKLVTKKVPRFKPNLRVDFPLVACDTILIRDLKIVDEVSYFHKKGNPVLVIFQDFKEIEKVKTMILTRIYKENCNKYNKITVFDGKDKDIEPGFNAGIKDAISLGTNICGRGTNIHCSSSLPLHVIVAYYSKNSRVMNQAFGRTARNGQVGTCRCICLKEQLVMKSRNKDQVDDIVDELFIKSEMQREFIEEFQKERSWIFDFINEKYKYSDGEKRELKDLRHAKINVNRIVAYKFKWPICMTYEMFLGIQAQRIFSLFNCPNCKYTWRLFQKYVREMILQSWSLMIEKFDLEMKMGDEKNDSSQSKDSRKTNQGSTAENSQAQSKENKIISTYFNEINIQNKKDTKKKKIDLYKQKLIEKKKELSKALEKYFPKNKSMSIVLNFIHICNQVINDHQEEILTNLNGIERAFISFGNYEKTYFQLGFKPYTLRSLSGTRITVDEASQANFIEDPELKYEKQMPNKKFTKASITERIDFIFNKIFQQISSALGGKTGLQFFMRRTLAGCEFGICLDLRIDNKNSKNNDNYVIIDKTPILFFTIYTWSMAPLLAGILIIVLIYVVKISMNIAKFIVNPTGTIISTVTKYAKDKIMELANDAIPNVSAIFLTNAIQFLQSVLDDQISKLEGYVKKEKNDDDDNEDSNGEKKKLDFLTVVKFLQNILFKQEGYDRITGLVEKKIEIPSIVGGVFEECTNYKNIVKIGLLLILCFATFLKNFQYKKRIEHQTKVAEEFNSIYDKKKSTKASKVEEVTNTNGIDDDLENNPHFIKAKEMATKQVKDEINFTAKPMEEKDTKQIEDILNGPKKEILDKLMSEDIKEKEVSITDIQLIKYPEIIKDDIYESTISFVYVSNNSNIYQYYSFFRTTPLTDNFRNEFSDHTFTCIRKSTNQNCIRHYLEISDLFYKVIALFKDKQHPAILPFAGYVLNLENSFILFEIIKNKYHFITLKDSLTKNYDYSRNYNEKGLILAYGIACGMEFLEKNDIYHYVSFFSRNVLLDDQLHPYIFPLEPNFNSYSAYYNNDSISINAPELQFYPTNKSAVYSYGVVLFEISNRSIGSFMNFLADEDFFNDSYDKDWINLMKCCLNRNPDDRPSFSEICDMIESFKFKPKGLRNYIEELKPKRL